MPADAAAPSDAALDAASQLDDRGTVDPSSYDGSLIASGVDLTAEREIVRRSCGPRRYGAGFVLAPVPTCSGLGCGPGIQCTRPQDCTDSPHARCLASGDGKCDYGQGPVTESSCVADVECKAQAGGRCTGTILQTFCQYANSCTTDSDCASGQRCDCGGSGNMLCFEADCRQDTDCGSGQKCLRTNQCNWGPNGDYRCTTPQDECVPYTNTACYCDYDVTKRRWLCMPDILCD